ncbi:hypothetical protein D3C81_1716320 [compost metagenome]
MNQAEMLGLGLDLRQAVADGVEQVAALVQLAFQAEHRQRITQRFALQAARVALEGADQGAITVAQVEVVATEHLQGVFGVAHQQAAQHTADIGLAGLPGAGDAIDQHGGLKHPAQGNQLLLQFVHARGLHGSAVSITPPPKHTSPS